MGSVDRPVEVSRLISKKYGMSVPVLHSEPTRDPLVLAKGFGSRRSSYMTGRLWVVFHERRCSKYISQCRPFRAATVLLAPHRSRGGLNNCALSGFLSKRKGQGITSSRCLRFRPQSRPLFKKHNGRGIIQIVVTGLAGLFVNLVDLGQAGKIYAVFLGRIQHQVNVFVHEA